jgi:hypothetical protein
MNRNQLKHKYRMMPGTITVGFRKRLPDDQWSPSPPNWDNVHYAEKRWPTEEEKTKFKIEGEALMFFLWVEPLGGKEVSVGDRIGVRKGSGFEVWEITKQTLELLDCRFRCFCVLVMEEGT